ncbi:MAG: thermonuclease family protein [Pseudomonadales bacterium]
MNQGVKSLLVIGLLALMLIVQRLSPDEETSASPVPAGQSLAVGQVIEGKTDRVVDGDSLYLQGHKKQVRLWAVDAPETSEAGYKSARAQLEKLALGEHLRCHIQDIDKYGRTVARCEDEKGRDLNRAMLASGAAQEYCRWSKNFYGYC